MACEPSTVMLPHALMREEVPVAFHLQPLLLPRFMYAEVLCTPLPVPSQLHLPAAQYSTHANARTIVSLPCEWLLPYTCMLLGDTHLFLLQHSKAYYLLLLSVSAGFSASGSSFSYSPQGAPPSRAMPRDSLSYPVDLHHIHRSFPMPLPRCCSQSPHTLSDVQFTSHSHACPRKTSRCSPWKPGCYQFTFSSFSVFIT